MPKEVSKVIVGILTAGIFAIGGWLWHSHSEILDDIGMRVEKNEKRYESLDSIYHVIDRRVLTIEGNRFTREHGNDIQAEIQSMKSEIVLVKEKVDNLEDSLGNLEIPPKEVKQRFFAIEKMLSSMQDKLDEMNALIIRTLLKQGMTHAE